MIPSRTDKQKNERYVEPKDHDYKYMYLTTIRQQDVESVKTRACRIHPRQTISGLLASRCCIVPFIGLQSPLPWAALLLLSILIDQIGSDHPK